MIDYQPLYNLLLDAKADNWVKLLPQQIASAFELTKHGTLSHWQSVIESMPELATTHRLLDANVIEIGRSDDLTKEEMMKLESRLKALHPWRKGPYNLFNIHIDTEWRSDWKWDRLKNHIAPLNHRLVLDVGCGNGYHCWRMLGAGAKMVVGIDPLLLNIFQFQVVRKLYGEVPVYLLPLGMIVNI